ncbi:hypothetical protein [Paenibacillus radicis (ex Gao et al. 2016)]|uniref:Uncharacterized protein n=1 Tax=Paenibacillus radicis (ex Gao et al. 2016) TaxID=1737354 RepID=A0A917GRF0_9BACL|nr:hypothetical protein [Paenibacillus radicis (ex Gao et al. 2016)]GGG54893.1 hypothetical protein GCM10010918_04680 [Paenibacillus radicis (ex Gao et al. 2016)]
MKGFYRLLNHETTMMLRGAVIISAAVLVISLILIQSVTGSVHENTVHPRFEELYKQSGSTLVFILGLAATCAWFAKSFYESYWGSKNIYTMLTLPVRREAYYLGKLGAFLICLSLLFAAQMATIWLGYSLMDAKFAAHVDASYTMTNGLLLALVRSSFLRLFFPLHFGDWLLLGSLLISLASGLYYGLICERSKRFWGLIFIAAAMIIGIRAVNQKMADTFFFSSYTGLYIGSILLIALTAWFVWHSIRLVRRGFIA